MEVPGNVVTKKLFSPIALLIQAYGLWVVLLLGLGFYAGTKYCASEAQKNQTKVIATGNFYDEGTGLVYDVKRRDIPAAPQ